MIGIIFPLGGCQPAPGFRAVVLLPFCLRQVWGIGRIGFPANGPHAFENLAIDLRQLLAIQDRLVSKVERLTAALVRYASLTYGS